MVKVVVGTQVQVEVMSSIYTEIFDRSSDRAKRPRVEAQIKRLIGVLMKIDNIFTMSLSASCANLAREFFPTLLSTS